MRFPWKLVRGFKVKSCADGTLRVEPDYINPWKGPEEGGGPGLFTRMALATWVEHRLQKRRTSTSTAATGQDGRASVEATVAPQQK